jgi:hypothetical protein
MNVLVILLALLVLVGFVLHTVGKSRLLLDVALTIGVIFLLLAGVIAI